MPDLSSKVALISGGASGIGAASARAIVAAGGRVVIADVNEPAGAVLAGRLGERAASVYLDVRDEKSWRNAVALTLAKFGRLNVLVNSAGIVASGKLGEFTLDQWRAVIDVNLTGVFLGMSSSIEALAASAPASIINIASVASFRGSAGMHAYTASKFGVRGISKSAAVELARRGIRVNSVHPGVTRTAMTEGLPESFADRLPMKRMAQPSEIAHIVVFLAGDECSFSTGSEFTADGGESAGPVRD